MEIAPIEPDVSQSVSVGLIVNEVIANTIKYAFPNNVNSEEIMFRMMQNADNLVELTKYDKGPGLSLDFDIKKNTGLGI